MKKAATHTDPPWSCLGTTGFPSKDPSPESVQEKNSTETLLELQRQYTEMRFLWIWGTQRTLVKERLRLEDGNDSEPVWVIDKPEPSPMRTESSPWYGWWSARLLRSLVMWCVTPLSISQAFPAWGEATAMFARGCHGGYDDWLLKLRPPSWGHLLALCPCTPTQLTSTLVTSLRSTLIATLITTLIAASWLFVVSVIVSWVIVILVPGLR